MPAGVLTIKIMPSVLIKPVYHTLKSSHCPKNNLLSNTVEKWALSACSLVYLMEDVWFCCCCCLFNYFSLLTVGSEFLSCCGLMWIGQLYLLGGAVSSPSTAVAARKGFDVWENGAGFWEGKANVQVGISHMVPQAEIVYSVFTVYTHWRSWPL